MDVKMNFRIITKNHAVDSKIISPQKIDFRADGTHEFHPTAWELRNGSLIVYKKFVYFYLLFESRNRGAAGLKIHN